MKIEIVKKGLEGFNGEAWLVKAPKEVSIKEFDGVEEICKTQYFVVSGVNTYSGWEVMVFPADKEGHILNYGDIVCVHSTHEDAIYDLKEYLKALK